MNFFNLPFACSHGLLSLAKFEQLPVGTKATKDSLQTCAPYGALRSYGVGPLAKLKSRKHFSLRGLLPPTTSAQVWAISRRTSIPSVRLAWSRECRDVQDFWRVWRVGQTSKVCGDAMWLSQLLVLLYSQFYEMGKSGMAYSQILKQRSLFLESLLLVFGVYLVFYPLRICGSSCLWKRRHTETEFAKGLVLNNWHPRF